MQWKTVAIAASAWVPSLALAQGLTLATGFDYTTGKYGGSETTDMLYVPFIAKYERERWTFKATVPYIRLTGPGNVVGAGADRVTLPGEAVGRRTESGLGDIVASAFYNAISERTAPFGLDLGAKVKLGTADETRGLGTGRNDYSLQADAFKPLGSFSLFGSLGRRWYGDPPGVDLHDVFYGAVGAAYRVNSSTSAGLAYDYRPAITDSGGKISELTAFSSHRVGAGWKLQPYVVMGFGDASPDWGAGAQFSRAY
jgi:hypothetical protein